MSYISSTQVQRSVRIARNSNLGSRATTVRTLGPISNSLFIGIILTLMGLLYLSQVTKANDYSFTIASLEAKKEQLVEENQTLTIEAARLSSVDRVTKSEIARGLSSPRSVEFVR